MGTTMNFINILNDNLSKEIIKPFLLEIESTIDNQMRIYKERSIRGIVAFNLDNKPSAASAIYSKTLKWIPLFEEHLCKDGLITSVETDWLSDLFSLPVISFSIRDSDDLFISYSDIKNDISDDYLKRNRYPSEEFPEFLYSYSAKSDHKKLKRIWSSRKYVLADDRMHDICELTGNVIVYDGGLFEGFDFISGH